MKRNIIIGGIFLFCLIFLSRCNTGKKDVLQEYRETRSVYGSFLTIQSFYDDEIDIYPIIQRCWQRLEEIQTLMNSRSMVGYVARINESGFYGVRVNDDVYALLKRAIGFSELTLGAFDVTIYPLVELWEDAIKVNALPANRKVEFQRGKVGFEYLDLQENNMVFLKKKGMKVDLGGIAKGYALDEVAKILLENGVNDFCINAESDIFCKGKREGEKVWLQDVRYPMEKSKVASILKISDWAISTSTVKSLTEQSTEGSIVISPETGLPPKKIISATVIAKTSEEADALATALRVMDRKKGIKLINSLEDVEAIIFQENRGKVSLYKSRGFNKHKK